ncbi:MAG TPA: hypothetical protein VL393_04510 [Candidatus Binataceae bacterium]|jgi:hypothetical protein|nr:hypothetical protein [Candidatus Binataceae bacterium]
MKLMAPAAPIAIPLAIHQSELSLIPGAINAAPIAVAVAVE